MLRGAGRYGAFDKDASDVEAARCPVMLVDGFPNALGCVNVPDRHNLVRTQIGRPGQMVLVSVRGKP